MRATMTQLRLSQAVRLDFTKGMWSRGAGLENVLRVNEAMIKTFNQRRRKVLLVLFERPRTRVLD